MADLGKIGRGVAGNLAAATSSRRSALQPPYLTPLDVAALAQVDNLDNERVVELVAFLYAGEREYLDPDWRDGDEVQDEFIEEYVAEREFLADLGPDGTIDIVHPLLPKDEGEPPAPGDIDIYFKLIYLRAIFIKRGYGHRDTLADFLAAYGYDDRDDALLDRMTECVSHFHLQCLVGGALPSPIASMGLRQTMVIKLRESSMPWFEGLFRRFRGLPVSDSLGEASGAAFLDNLRKS